MATRLFSPAVSRRAANQGLRDRAIELLKQEIDFISNSSFHMKLSEPDDLVESTLRKLKESKRPPADLPAHLRNLCESELLSHKQEAAMFRRMNLLKYQANALRSQLDPEEVSSQQVSTIETLLGQAHTLRDHLIRANMRLVISIVKKFVEPQHSFDELLSDGALTLMKAIEKFDYDRGFRFSTYAYRSIVRSSSHLVATDRKRNGQCVQFQDDWSIGLEESSNVSPLFDQVWSDLRDLTTSLLNQLNHREQIIIRSRYALGAEHKVRTFQELANELGVSKERVRQLEQRAIAKLRDMASEYHIDDLFAASMV